MVRNPQKELEMAVLVDPAKGHLFLMVGRPAVVSGGFRGQALGL